MREHCVRSVLLNASVTNETKAISLTERKRPVNHIYVVVVAVGAPHDKPTAAAAVKMRRYETIHRFIVRRTTHAISYIFIFIFILLCETNFVVSAEGQECHILVHILYL